MASQKRIFNIFGAIMNLVNSIIGLGIFALPKAFDKSGIILGIILSFVACFLVLYTSDLMVVTANKIEKNENKKISAYGELCDVTLGQFAFYFLTTITFLMSFFCMCVYNIVFRKEIESIIGDILKNTFQYGQYVLLGVSIVLILPFCLLRNINKLSSLSSVSILLVLIISIIALERSVVYNKLMKHITIQKMRINEEKLVKERILFACNLKEGRLKIPDFDYDLLINLDCKASPVKLNESQNDVRDAHVKYLYENYRFKERVAKSTKNMIIDLLTALGVFSSAFICQQSTFSIYRQLKKQTKSEWRITQIIAFSLVYILNITIALSGIIGQGVQVGETIFEKMKLRYFNSDSGIDYVVNLGRIFLLATIALTFPLQNFFARKNFFWLILSIIEKFTGKEYDKENPPGIIFYTTSILMFTATLLVGIFVNSIIRIYTMMGVLFASPMIYILPCLCYLGVNGNILQSIRNTYPKQSFAKNFKKIVFPFSVTIFGILVVIISTCTTIYSWVTE